MNYENEPCPICGRPMAKEENIIRCPVCGTPQHRDCWLARGKCIHEEQHGDGFLWKPAGEQLEGVAVDDIKAYVRRNPQYYIPEFYQLSEEKRTKSWNWSAFLFPSYWFFYRKLYALGILFAGLICITSIFTTLIKQDYQTKQLDHMQLRMLLEDVSEEERDELLFEAATAWLAEDQTQKAYVLKSLPILGLNLCIGFCAGIIANGQYKKKALVDVKALRAQSETEEDFQTKARRKGGTSALFVFIYLLCGTMLNLITTALFDFANFSRFLKILQEYLQR